MNKIAYVGIIYALFGVTVSHCMEQDQIKRLTKQEQFKRLFVDNQEAWMEYQAARMNGFPRRHVKKYDEPNMYINMSFKLTDEKTQNRIDELNSFLNVCKTECNNQWNYDSYKKRYDDRRANKNNKSIRWDKQGRIDECKEGIKKCTDIIKRAKYIAANSRSDVFSHDYYDDFIEHKNAIHKFMFDKFLEIHVYIAGKYRRHAHSGKLHVFGTSYYRPCTAEEFEDAHDDDHSYTQTLYDALSPILKGFLTTGKMERFVETVAESDLIPDINLFRFAVADNVHLGEIMWLQREASLLLLDVLVTSALERLPNAIEIIDRAVKLRNESFKILETSNPSLNTLERSLTKLCTANTILFDEILSDKRYKDYYYMSESSVHSIKNNIINSAWDNENIFDHAIEILLERQCFSENKYYEEMHEDFAVLCRFIKYASIPLEKSAQYLSELFLEKALRNNIIQETPVENENEARKKNSIMAMPLEHAQKFDTEMICMFLDAYKQESFPKILKSLCDHGLEDISLITRLIEYRLKDTTMSNIKDVWLDEIRKIGEIEICKNKPNKNLDNFLDVFDQLLRLCIEKQEYIDHAEEEHRKKYQLDAKEMFDNNIIYTLKNNFRDTLSRIDKIELADGRTLPVCTPDILEQIKD